MEGASDTVFRQIVAECGNPGVMFSEFVNVDGLFSAGAAKVAERLRFEEVERPMVAQLWGLETENFQRAGELMVELGFDGVDINMGCPERKVIKSGACAALINDQQLAGEIIEAVKKGVRGRIAVSVKTRIGFSSIVSEQWGGFLLEQGIDALIIHGRTVKEKSLVPAHWEEIGKVVKLRDRLGMATAIIGNGDVMDLDEANRQVEQWGVDGVMIGRGVFRDPWVFSKTKSFALASKEDKLAVLSKHIGLFDEVWGGVKNYHELKRFYKVYVRGFAGANRLREKLMETRSIEEVTKVLEEITD
jgi:tRNA-dihydrouridine synthase